MRHIFRIALAAAALIGGAGLAAAQDVVIQPQQQTVIREYVHKNPLASISLLGLELNVGSTVPDEVELHRIDVPDVRYQYVVINDHTVLVDPDTRRIIEVVR
ncbi:DUF1236 domain-containing protein [Mesorhizobium sp. KR2-14]|uniref:DUF1236 domain-containing protein n=1 Tax=Mesorhizobium sp. KR2-14 TaxID=3156610 RepID=UPI0032B56237